MTDIQKLFWTFAIVMMVGILVWIIETMRMPKAKRQWESIIVIAAALLLIGLWVHAARAHDHKHPDRNDYLKSLHSKNKTWCCKGDDYDSFDDWETKGSGYRVKFRGQWFDVPDGALIDGPNEVGVPMLWMNKGFSGLSVRCFMPGPLT